MKKIEITKNGKTLKSNVSNRVDGYINSLIKTNQDLVKELKKVEHRGDQKFRNFSKLVFSEVKDTKKIGKTCKEISFANGKKIRYHCKNCNDFRYWQGGEE